MDNFDSQHNNFKKALPYLRNIYTSVFATVTALVFSFFISDGYIKTYNNYQIDLLYHVKAVLVILLPIVIVATVALVYNYFDNVDLFNKREYFESKSKKLLIARTPYLVSFALPLLLSTLLLSESFHLALTFFFPGLNVAVARFLSVAVMAILRLVQLWSLQDKWQSEIDNPLFIEKAMFKRNRDMYLFKPHQLILQPIGFFFAFGALSIFVGYISIPTLIFTAIISLLNMIMNPEALWTMSAIPLWIIVAIVAFVLLYNTRRRRILIKKLKQMQKEGLAKVEIKGYKYLSATLIFLPFSIKITDREGEVYNCFVAASGEINAPIFFKKDEYIIEHGFHMRGGALIARGGSFAYAVDVSNMGGKENPTNLVLGFRTSHKFKFPDGEGHNVVILNPTPTTAFAMEDRSFRSIDTGENMGEYTIYTASGIFNHIERQSRKGKREFDY